MNQMLEELRKQAAEDEHGKPPSHNHVREFWRGLELASKKTKVCTRCKAKYAVEMFNPTPYKNVVFFRGKWHISRESVCLPCEIQKNKIERWLPKVG